MKRKRRWPLVLGILIALGVGWIAWPRVRSPILGIGPHKVSFEWVTFDEAHPKRLLSINLPWGGTFEYPSPSYGSQEIAGAMWGDSSELVSGYLLINSDRARLDRGDDNLSGGYRTEAGQTLLWVGYAPSPARRKIELWVGDECVELTLPYDPSKLAARVDPGTVTAGPYTLNFTFAESSTSEVVMHLDVDGGVDDGCFSISYGSGGYTGSPPLVMEGKRLPSGDIELKGTLCLADKNFKPIAGKSYPFSLTLPLKPLALMANGP